ncbi:serine hydrolase domain-containing protein [Streptomyces alboflavus]|uniref:serine hydrolase domain-containing protein n=1 Tax=Streptomyces alboflavus TaxID=67267 RepID=UPI001F02FEB8|nr:serine hydrolase domain-containing protein [Streptomyces alboflavus]
MTCVEHTEKRTSARALPGRRRAGRATAVAVVTAALTLLVPVADAAARPGAWPRPAAPTPAPPPDCDAARGAVEASLGPLVDRHGIPGVAADVVDRRCARWSVARGVADLDSGRPMDAGDRLRIGSVSKTFTVTVVVQLAAEGRIGLDAPVERYLPGLIRGNGHHGRKITVRQLLQHTSGLPDYVEALAERPVEEWRFRHFEPREQIATALKMPRPAKKWHYATTNTVVAGLIVEKVTGHRVEAEVDRRVIRKLGLRDTYWPGDGTRIRGAHSRSYMPGPGGGPDGRVSFRPGGEASSRGGGKASSRVDGTEWNMTFGGAGGALVSTPADVNRFFGALFGGKLLPARWLAEMKRTVPADPDRLWPGARYGLGLVSSPLACGGRWWGHGGTVPGGHRALGAVGPGGRTVALALNQVPATDHAEQDFRAVVDSALCPPDRTSRLKENP